MAHQALTASLKQDLFLPMCSLPLLLAERGVTLRKQTEADVGFLRELYISIRWLELQVVPWPDESKLAFLADQFSLQHHHYTTHYAEADFLIIEQHGAPIGRLCVDHGHPSDMRIVDIALLPHSRGTGIGTALLKELLAQARAQGKVTSIHVEQENPAKRLYSRLGFEDIHANGPYWLMEAPVVTAEVS